MSIIYKALKRAEALSIQKTAPAIKAPVRNLPVWLSVTAAVAVVFFALAGIVFLSRVKNTAVSVAVKPSVPAAELFLPQIKEHGEAILKKKASGAYLLEGVIFDSRQPLAIINGRLLKKTERIDDLEVTDIRPQSVLLFNSQDNSNLTLTLP